MFALALCLTAALLGWIGSYRGYQSAAAVVRGARTLPKESQLDDAANRLAWTALAPTAVAVPLGLGALALLVAFRRGGSSEEETI